MRLKMLLAAALPAILAAPIAYAIEAPHAVPTPQGVISIDDRDHCDALLRDQKETLDRIDHARDGDERARLEAHLRDVNDQISRECHR